MSGLVSQDSVVCSEVAMVVVVLFGTGSKSSSSSRMGDSWMSGREDTNVSFAAAATQGKALTVRHQVRETPQQNSLVISNSKF